MKTKNSKTQQLLTLAQRQFGENIQIEYKPGLKPGGVTSGWYLSKNEHSYCIGKNDEEATLWLGRVPSKIKPKPFTNHVVNWINLGYQEYLDHAIACQLTDKENEYKSRQEQRAKIKQASILKKYGGGVCNCSWKSQESLKKILTNFQQMGESNSALLVLIWALGMPLKRFIGYYPNLILVGQVDTQVDTLVKSMEKTVWADTLPGFYRKIWRGYLSGIPKIFCRYTNPHISLLDELPKTIKIELLKTTQPPSPPWEISWPGTGWVTEWLDFLCSITRSEFDDILKRCYQDYCHVTANVPDKVNNVVVMLLTWKLICLLLGRLQWEEVTLRQVVDDVEVSIYHLCA